MMEHAGHPPSISLVIAVYERPDTLAMVLESLRDQTFRDLEVVVADDGSGPAIAEVVRRYEAHFPIQHAWHEDEGFRKTVIVNRAATMAKAGYLVFIDGDCILHRRFLERHWRRRAQSQALSGRRVMFDAAFTARVTIDHVRNRSIQRCPLWWNHAGKIDRWHGLYMPWLWPFRRGRDTYPILGCNFSLNKEDFMRVNGYDERIIGRGLEDVNLWRRLVNAGIAVRTVTQEALQYHLHHSADPIPHSDETVEAFRSTTESWTPHGIVKESPSAEAS